MQGVVPHREVAPLLQQGFVALASDVDEPEAEVLDLARNLDDAHMLPFVIFASPGGAFLGGSSGAVTPAGFRRTLEGLARPS